MRNEREKNSGERKKRTGKSAGDSSSERNHRGPSKKDSRENRSSKPPGKKYDDAPKRTRRLSDADEKYTERKPSGTRPDREFKEKKFDKRERPGSKDKFRKEKDERKESSFKERTDRGSEKPRERKFSEKRSFTERPPRKHSGKSFKRRNENEPDDGRTRLNKFIANSGICSRRDADNLISAGVVSVNSEIITQMGFKVGPDDVVRYHDRVIKKEKSVYVLLNKPKDFITTTDDPFERKTVMNLVKGAGKERIYPVGRLDRATTGLLLMTNDGELAKKLTHPTHKVKKIYHVELDHALAKNEMKDILNGIELEDGMVYVDAIEYVGDGSDKALVGVELHSGRNRVVRRIFESLNYKVKKLDRVVFAGLTKKDLPRGKWRFLSEKEVSFLKMLGTGTPKVPKK